MSGRALITGINGQDGSYLAELLLSKGYEVAGIVRRSSVAEQQTSRIEDIRNRLQLFYGDVTDVSSLMRAFTEFKPTEIYNLAAQSHVGISFQSPLFTTQVSGMGALNVFDTARQICPEARIYQASSSEMFGNSIDFDGYQRETTCMLPVSPYGCAKVFAHNCAVNYRCAYGMYISCGILFNHESPRRGANFVTAKVVKTAVEMTRDPNKKLLIGNVLAARDWGHAKDYVEVMWRMLQHGSPSDFVVATGKSHSVQDLIDYVFGALGVSQERIETDARYLRKEELHLLRGDSTKAREKLGWYPEYGFETMLDEMIEHWSNVL